LKGFEAGSLKPVPQDHRVASYAPLLKKSDGHLNWNRSSEELANFVRGLTPWPGAFTFHGKKRLKILKVEVLPSQVVAAPGTIVKGFGNELRVATRNGALAILEIQGASGKRLAAEEFLRGNQIPIGSVFS